MKMILLASCYFYMVALAISLFFRDMAEHDLASYVKQKGTIEVTRISQVKTHIARKKATLGQDQFKFDNPNEFIDYHWGIRTRMSEDIPGYLAGHSYNELLDARKSKFYRTASAARLSDLKWTERGPSNVPGRTRAILILPVNLVRVI